jgi:integrase/recombinase XerD
MGRKNPEILEPSEAAALVGACRKRSKTGRRNRAILLLMLRAGLRVSEVCNAKRENVREDGWLEIKQGKGKKDRAVQLQDQETLDALASWLAVAPESPYLVSTLKGGRVSRDYVWRMSKRMARRAGIPETRVHPHILRHTFATESLRMGVPLPHLQTLLGHANIATTGIYLHVRAHEAWNALAEARLQEQHKKILTPERNCP